MTKQEILKELNKGKTYEEISEIAQNLLYKLIPGKIEKRSIYTFESLNKEDLEKLGFEVYEVGTDDPKKLEKKIKSWGFLYTYNVFFHPELKEVWCVEDYIPGAYVDVADTFSFSKLISKNQFKEFLADKIMEKLESWEKLKNFFNSLVKDEKDFYERELNEEKKAEIIKQALEKARKEGLIK